LAQTISHYRAIQKLCGGMGPSARQRISNEVATPTARKAKQRGRTGGVVTFFWTVKLAAWHALVTNGDLR